MNAAAIQASGAGARPSVPRIDPRRPALQTPAGLRRIVLGSDEGERLTRGPATEAAVKPLRSAGPFAGCLLVVLHTDRGALDEHAREVIAAAALLARPDEAVVLIALGECRDDLAAAGVDRAEWLVVDARWQPGALAAWVAERCGELSPRHVLMPDAGANADLGRRIALRTGMATAAHVVEIAQHAARVRMAGGKDALAPCPTFMLLARQVARSALPFVGHGKSSQADPALVSPGGVEDLGVEDGNAQNIALEEADFILAAGNGVSDVALFNNVALALGAATAASRVAVDDGRFPRLKQVGATGRTVQARGYVAIGISGAVQHLQGIRECRHVIAVNTDVSAPIAQRAEFTVQADAQALLQALLVLARKDAPPATVTATTPSAAIAS